MTIGQVTLPANGWRARSYQIPLWKYLRGGGKRAVAVWHRRAGKDDVCLHWTAIAAHKRVGNYWHMLPMANQARKAIWEAVNPHTGRKRIDEAFPVETREATRDNDMLIRFKNGSTWQVVGSDNYNGLVGAAPIGIVFSEWALADPAAWAYLRPILAENGGWALFIYTSRGRNHGYTTFQLGQSDPDWFAQRLPVSETGVFPPAVLAKELAEYQKDFGEDQGLALYEQEYDCSFDAAILGAIYGAEIRRMEQQGRLTKVPHDPALPVNTVWDIGYTDDTPILFFQVVIGEVRVIDALSANGHGVDYYCAELLKRAEEHGYNYAQHWLPHDAEAHHMAAAGRTVVAQIRDYRDPKRPAVRLKGIVRALHNSQTEQQGILAARHLFPRLWVDAEKGAGFINAMRNFRREWDDEKKCFTDTPVRDWTNHYADTGRYLAWVWQLPPPEPEPEKPMTTRFPSFNELMKMQARSHEDAD